MIEENIEPYKLTHPGMAGQKKWNGSCITDTRTGVINNMELESEHNKEYSTSVDQGRGRRFHFRF
jgi:hypothetical protein